MIIKDNEPAASKVAMSLSAFGIQGKRNHMEDYFDIGYQMLPPHQRRDGQWPYEYFYFAIFDGHGGADAAQFAKKNLLKCIVNLKDFWSKDDEDVKRAIRQGFADCHAKMRVAMTEWSRGGKSLPSTAGTTASILFIRNGKFYTGHVGDSRIVISKEDPGTKNWIAEQLTEDHKPESKKEIQRIERAGGQVKDKTGVQRVVWRRPVLTSEVCWPYPNSVGYSEMLKRVPSYPVDESIVEYYQAIPFLAIARSLGDFWSINPHSGQYIVSPEPDVFCRPITPNDRSILLASDGLWNVMDAMKAVRFLQELENVKSDAGHAHDYDHLISDNYYDVSGDKKQHAQSLVYIAYQIWERKRLRSDNITVVTAILHDILSKADNSSKTYSTRFSTHQTPKESIISPALEPQQPVQICGTNCFEQNIIFDGVLEFRSTAIPILEDKSERERLEFYLVLPPTILEQDFCVKITHPRNYERISRASYRMITQANEGPKSVYIINIKTVSDDLADEKEKLTYTGKSGKQVSDSSAQVSEWMHDFNQPWCELAGQEISYYSDKTENHREVDVEEENPEDIERERDWDISSSDAPSIGLELLRPELMHLYVEDDGGCGQVDDECFEDADDGFSMDDLKSNVVIDDTVEEKIKQKRMEIIDRVESISETKCVKKDSTTKASIPQLRCLLNCTPVLRRSKRSKAYVSLSENTKRKNNLNQLSSISRTKRRKSQPVRCNASSRA